MNNPVLILKAIAVFLLLTSFNLFSEELVVYVDVDAGETSVITIDTNLYSEATFSFQLEKVRNSDTFPPGVNFVFSDKAQKFKILFGFMEHSNFSKILLWEWRCG
ncbi:hypothetical protein [Alteromonas sp. KUL49]|uniref:hypothetical protein n=1 Tax=Alteromonas sp. KUL49 TaxID=2480798 RepID=UPI00102EF15A|nr:hypothetical protein [Alteromonas sp. KUL49]TAP40699.1 hypothetical protein EYS00_06165 [Alteromonas sp. KUL49]GEA10867.1 hypothetical protein KUL49_12420 [Alteromonas sp. KUL49]